MFFRQAQIDEQRAQAGAMTDRVAGLERGGAELRRRAERLETRLSNYNPVNIKDLQVTES